MFQFPGFALKPLCIQGKSTCFGFWMSAARAQARLRPRVGAERTLRSNNQKPSGGFPHSEIHGSKPIPGSPWLNAGYHVLHRLLLPRHPPNALFALDLTRKEQGRWFFGPHYPSGVKSRILTHACSERPRSSRRLGTITAHG